MVECARKQKDNKIYYLLLVVVVWLLPWISSGLFLVDLFVSQRAAGGRRCRCIRGPLDQQLPIIPRQGEFLINGRLIGFLGGGMVTSTLATKGEASSFKDRPRGKRRKGETSIG